MKRKRFFALLLCTALLMLSACTPSETNPPVHDDSTADITTVAPQNTTIPTPADTTTAPQQTTAPAPIETTAPVQTSVVDIPIDAHGSFSSNTGSNLEIHLDWSVLAITDSTVTIRAEAYITCYSISVSARQGGILKIGNATQNFSTAEIYQEKDIKQTIPFASSIVDVPRNLNGLTVVDVSVSWPFIGTYSGIKIDRLACEGVIMLGTPTTP